MRKREIFKQFKRCVFALETVIRRKHTELTPVQKWFLREWQRQTESYRRFCFFNDNYFTDSYLMMKDFYISICGEEPFNNYMLSALESYFMCITYGEPSEKIQNMLERDNRLSARKSGIFFSGSGNIIFQENICHTHRQGLFH